MKKNNIEDEIDRIRIKLYEETKNLTHEEHARRSNELAQKLAAQYGFTIGSPTSRTKISADERPAG